MKRILARLVALSLLGLLVLTPSAWAQEEVTVRMEDNFFAPTNITVEPGTTVTWVHSGNNPHSTTSYDGLWDSGIMAAGSRATFPVPFSGRGAYGYLFIRTADPGMIRSGPRSGGSPARATPRAPGPTPATRHPPS